MTFSSMVAPEFPHQTAQHGLRVPSSYDGQANLNAAIHQAFHYAHRMINPFVGRQPRHHRQPQRRVERLGIQFR